MVIRGQVPLQNIRHRIGAGRVDKASNDASALQYSEWKSCRVSSPILVVDESREKHPKYNEQADDLSIRPRILRAGPGECDEQRR